MRNTGISVLIMLVTFIGIFNISCIDNLPLNNEKTTAEHFSEKVEVTGMQTTVDALQSIQPDDPPGGWNSDTEINPGDLFDINDYFSVFTHLSMEKGYVLDYFLVGDDFFGDCPLIYTRKKSAQSFNSYEEYEKQAEKAWELRDTYSFVGFVMGEDPQLMEDKIHIDGTPEGFAEYVILQEMGAQFYLFWHANYNDSTVICNSDVLENKLKEALETFGDYAGAISSRPDATYDELMAKAKFIDFTPIVEYEYDNETVRVSVVIFTKWGGFIKPTYTISQEYPHTILDFEYQTLIEYECGVMF